MDGPLADYDSYCSELGIEPEEAKLLSVTYLHLFPTEGAIKGVKALETLGYYPFVLSKIPSRNPGAATEKHHWLHRYFPSLKHRLILSPDKGCIGTARDLLIDDHPEWANAHNFPGEILTFKTTTNQGQTWDEIIDFLSHSSSLRQERST